MSVFKKVSLMCICLILLVCVFAACDNSGDNGEETMPSYTITYDANGGTVGNGSQTVTYDSDYNLEVPAREGYTFAGWYDGETKYENGKWSVSNDVTLTAKWTANTYAVKYDANGGNAVADLAVKYDADFTLAISEKTGYTFAGWYNGETKYEDGKWSVANDVTLTAKWTANTYTITFDSKGGSAVENLTVTYDSAYTLATPERTGYTFAGWYNGEVKYEDGTWNEPVNVTLTAAWTANTYTITFDSNNGSAVENLTVTYDAAYTLEAPTLTGYTFAGWYNGETLYEDGTWNEAADVTLTARWTVNTYIIHFNSNGGSSVADLTVTYNENYTLATTPERAGYTFAGWYSGETKYEGGKWTLTNDINLTAQWDIITYNITYINNGGEHSNVTTYTVEDAITLTAPTKTGYTFLGWTYEGQTSPILNVTIAKGSVGDKEYTAHWGINSYSVTTSVNMRGVGTVSGAGSYEYNSTVTVSVDSTNLGYTWLGWYDAGDNLLTAETSYTFTLGAVDTALTAKWKISDDIADFYFTSTDTTCTINFAKDTTKTSLTIPNYVTSIGVQAFMDHNTLESIIIGNGVTSIGQYAFRDCTSLANITIPDSVKLIDYGAFYGCSSLTSLTIGNGVTSIGQYAFRDCTSLASITIPDSVKLIDYGAFYGCSDLASLNLGNGVTSIGTYAFCECTSLTSVTITDNVVTLGYGAFDECSALTSVTIESGATEIVGNFFGDCMNIESATIPAAMISYISKNNLKTVIINSGTSIDDNSFYYCNTLKSVTLPDGITSIGSRAFYYCDNLTSINIPASVTSIGDEAFYHCRNLARITIPGNITSIGNNTFTYCESLASVNIPNNVTSIGARAFQYCHNLVSVTIGEKVTSIGDEAFFGCGKLVEVINLSNLPIVLGSSRYGDVAYYAKEVHTGASKIVNKDGYLFYTYDDVNYLLGYVGADTELVLPSDYNGESYVIYEYAFQYNDRITNVVISDGVTSIGRVAFWHSPNLTNVTIGNSVTNIGNQAFEGCTSLMSIIIPDNVMDLGGLTFDGCSSLASVTIGNGVTEIKSQAFMDCTSLTNVIIGNKVKSIGLSAFIGCSQLESITIPDSVTSIGYKAFYDCVGLMSVTIGNGIRTIGESAFDGCINLTSINLPDGVTSVAKNAFFGCTKLASITFDGTKAAFHNITLGENWNYQVPATTVTCSDGTVSLT